MKNTTTTIPTIFFSLFASIALFAQQRIEQREELDRLVSTNIKEKAFKMYCFWSGEKALGALDGVLSTQAGFSNHSEVVKVQYESRLIQEEQLTAYTKKKRLQPS